jgi:hypothetical protein
MGELHSHNGSPKQYHMKYGTESFSDLQAKNDWWPTGMERNSFQQNLEAYKSEDKKMAYVELIGESKTHSD